MASQELLTRYISGGLLTNAIPFDVFEKIVVQSCQRNVPKETIQEWYSDYERKEFSTAQSIGNGVQEFLKRTRETVLLDLEKKQMAESFTLGEIINNLYTVDQILDTQLQTVNMRIDANAVEFEDFNRLLVDSNEANRTRTNRSLDNLLEKLKTYKYLIENFGNQDSKI